MAHLPANSIPLVVRRLNKAMRQRYESFSAVRIKGEAFLPGWAVTEVLAQGFSQISLETRLHLAPALARRGELDILRELAQQGEKPMKGYLLQWARGCAVCGAAAGGHLSTVRWLLEKQQCWCGDLTHLAPAAAASGGHVHVLAWLLKYKKCTFEWDQFTFIAAAGGGHVAAAQWLLGTGRIDLQAVRTLYFMGRPWAVYSAVRGGHMGMVVFLHGVGCKWNSRCALAAKAYGHMDIFAYLVLQGCPIGHDEEVWDYWATLLEEYKLYKGRWIGQPHTFGEALSSQEIRLPARWHAQLPLSGPLAAELAALLAAQFRRKRDADVRPSFLL